MKNEPVETVDLTSTLLATPHIGRVYANVWGRSAFLQAEVRLKYDIAVLVLLLLRSQMRIHTLS